MIPLPGFDVHAKDRIHGNDGETIERVVRYISRVAVSVDRVEHNFENGSVTIYERQDRSFSGKLKSYRILDFIALLASHISSPYEALVYY